MLIIIAYTQFREITEALLSGHKVEREVANVISNSVWNKSRDVRDCVKIGAMARTTSDVEFIVDKFLGPKDC